MCLRAQRRKIYPLAPAAQLRDLIAQCFSVGLPVDKADEQPGRRRARSTRTDFREVSDEEAQRLRDKIRTWFFHAKIEDIREDNIREVRPSSAAPTLTATVARVGARQRTNARGGRAAARVSRGHR